jgi:ABC-type multidrug transport system fused ATPase/permease subunit
LVIADGQIVENGSPNALLAQPDSHFSTMVRADSAFTLAQMQEA